MIIMATPPHGLDRPTGTKRSKKCGYCNHETSAHYGERGGIATIDEAWGLHHCHICDKARMELQRESADETRKKQVRFWVIVAIIGAVIAGFLIHNWAEHEAAYNAGHAWAKNELSAGYGNDNPDDPDPCDDARSVSFASAGYDFNSWFSGCEAASGN